MLAVVVEAQQMRLLLVAQAAQGAVETAEIMDKQA